MTTRPSHRIADVAFTDDGSWIVCSCGERLEDADPERIALGFQDHRQAFGLERKSLSSGTLSDTKRNPDIK